MRVTQGSHVRVSKQCESYVLQSIWIEDTLYLSPSHNGRTALTLLVDIGLHDAHLMHLMQVMTSVIAHYVVSCTDPE